MLPAMRAAWSSDILHKAAEIYGAEPRNMQDCGGGENFVFGYERNGKKHVLRIGHSLHRTRQLIQAEVDWLNYLVDRHIPIASPCLSQNGRWVEEISQEAGDECFLAVAFERAPGEDLGGGSAAKEKWWNGKLFEQWGALMGRLHQVARDYRVGEGAPRRPDWDEWPIVEIERWIPEDQGAVSEYGADLKKRLSALTRDHCSYGLIHGDFTQINFTVHRGAMTLFDFDRAEYAWFVKDIAVAVFCAVRGTQPAPPDFVRTYLDHLMRGYRRESSLDTTWLKLIPEFMKLERLSEYALAYRRLGGSRPQGETLRYLSDTREDIEQDAHVIPFDFGAWAESLC